MLSRRSLLSRSLALSLANAAVLEDALRPPDYVEAEGVGRLSRSGSRWTARGLEVSIEPVAGGLPIVVSPTNIELTRVHLRWHVAAPGNPLLLGDAWERSYGDLSWRSLVPERVMPWYFLLYDSGRTHGYGVMTGAGALCFWQLDGQGISLWLDLRNGGSGVQLGKRQLHAATVVSETGGDSFTLATSFCRKMCPHPRLPGTLLYGTNDWYYCYGKNSAAQTLRDADLVGGLAQSGDARPFAVIDMGWAEGSKTFPSMPGLASQIKQRRVRPGLWIRPLEAPAETAQALLLPGRKEPAYDPTIPEALALVTKKVSDPVAWGYELIKHDFSTYDLLGRWGKDMGPNPTLPGWHLNDRSRTNAEVVRDFYGALRAAAGERTLLLGCNTIGHLGAGIFEAQRTGDDTSGRVWERTRRMGVNTLAFRLPQNNIFFAQDPDCVGITKDIPWTLNRQWLDLIARSGAALFISPEPSATGSEQRAAIREAFGIAAKGGGEETARPANWFRDSTPEDWKAKQSLVYDWNSPAGCSPFDV